MYLVHQCSPWVNFTNILRAAFTPEDPKSAKNSQVKQVFALLGSVCVKAARKIMVKLTPYCKYLKSYYIYFYSTNVLKSQL